MKCPLSPLMKMDRSVQTKKQERKKGKDRTNKSITPRKLQFFEVTTILQRLNRPHLIQADVFEGRLED